jgi:hypothetical protein
VCLVGLGGLVAGLCSLEAEAIPSDPVSISDLTQIQSQIEEERQRREQLRERSANLCERIFRKEQVIVELRAGRLTLLEAAAIFGELNAREPGCMEQVREVFGGQNDAETLCRQVIQWSHELGPCSAEELEEILPRDGGVQLQ